MNSSEFQAWDDAIKDIESTGTDVLPIYLNKVHVGVLPSKCSRHNAPSRAHALSKMVKTMSSSHSSKEAFVIVCERKDVFALGCAIPRVFPTYCRKTFPGKDDPVASKNVSFYIPPH